VRSQAYPRGALLFACNSLGNFPSTNIQLYASTNDGPTWQFLSTIDIQRELIDGVTGR
jgi:hypothetical protein